MWNGTLVMISFAGLGEAFGGGDVAGVGVSAGVGDGVGVGLASSVEGVAAGEFVCWLVGWVQAANANRPTTRAVGTTPILTLS
jgi:hypothetical protein